MQCYDLKLQHDACFYKWYWDKFLKGLAEPGQPCEEQFLVYRKCLETKMKDAGVEWVMQKRVVDDSSLKK